MKAIGLQLGRLLLIELRQPLNYSSIVMKLTKMLLTATLKMDYMVGQLKEKLFLKTLPVILALNLEMVWLKLDIIMLLVVMRFGKTN